MQAIIYGKIKGKTVVPWDSLDPGIVGIVRALNDMGFETTMSCEGHLDKDDGLAPHHPWVTLSPESFEKGKNRLFHAMRESSKESWHNLAGISVRFVPISGPNGDEVMVQPLIKWENLQDAYGFIDVLRTGKHKWIVEASGEEEK